MGAHKDQGLAGGTWRIDRPYTPQICIPMKTNLETTVRKEYKYHESYIVVMGDSKTPGNRVQGRLFSESKFTDPSHNTGLSHTDPHVIFSKQPSNI